MYVAVRTLAVGGPWRVALRYLAYGARRYEGSIKALLRRY